MVVVVLAVGKGGCFGVVGVGVVGAVVGVGVVVVDGVGDGIGGFQGGLYHCCLSH